MATKFISRGVPQPDLLIIRLKIVIVILGLAVATTMLQRYGFVNFTDWRHFIPADESNNFVFTG